MSFFQNFSLSSLYGPVLIGLINGSFYALLSLGLAVIFGMLRVVNMAHGAQYMLGALLAWLTITQWNWSYWTALVLVPLFVAAISALMERVFLSRLYRLDHLYGLLLTLGIALVLEGGLAYTYGTAGLPLQTPSSLSGILDLGFSIVPIYRAWVIAASVVACLATWLLIEKTSIGARLRAATDNPSLVQVFGINVPRLLTLTYAAGAGLAALAGVMAAPVYQVSPLMGQNLLIVVFAVVVVGGMGSIGGAVITGFVLGIIEAFTKVIYPEAASVVIFLLMALVLLVRPAGLFGRGIITAQGVTQEDGDVPLPMTDGDWRRRLFWTALAGAGVALAPLVIYPVFLMKILCFALFAAAFNLLLSYVGMLSFGHAAFFGGAAYVAAYLSKTYALSTELAIIAGAAFASVLGLLFGILAICRSGIYFAMITLALAQMFLFFCMQSPWTGGENGIQDVPRGRLFGAVSLDDPLAMYYFVAVVCGVGIWMLWRVVRSPFGAVLNAIRDNEPRAVSLGYRAERYKLGAFVLSAFFAGLAGAMKAMVFQLASLTDVGWQMSGEVILMTLLGGIGTFVGPLFGGGLIVSLEGYLAPLSLPIPVMLGCVFIACVMLFRGGLAGVAERAFRAAKTPWLARHRGQPSTTGNASLDSGVAPRE